MTLTIDAAVQTLSDTAHNKSRDSRLEGRLAAVQDILREDLRWVELALGRAVGEGPGPGVDAARHLVERAGKRIRPTALLLGAACFGEVRGAAREMAVVTELVHSATLLHDDVIDDGTERRGADTARMVWGNAVSILAGDLLLVHSLSATGRHAPALMPELVSTLRELVDGEIIQLRGRHQLDLTERTYMRILEGKTASLFRFATLAGARLGGAPEAEVRALAGFGELLGMAFQLVDDVLDYAGEATGKDLCADLREGKVTLPLVLAVADAPELSELLELIHAGDELPLDRVRERVLGSGACDDVRRRARDYTDRAVTLLGEVRPSRARDLLCEVASQLSARTR